MFHPTKADRTGCRAEAVIASATLLLAEPPAELASIACEPVQDAAPQVAHCLTKIGGEPEWLTFNSYSSPYRGMQFISTSHHFYLRHTSLIYIEAAKRRNLRGETMMASVKKRGKWTGFADKTLWDWLQLLIIPIVLIIVGSLFNIQQVQISEANAARQHLFDQQVALDQQQEATLKTYLDDMANLLLNYKLRESQPGDEVRNVARARTLTALRRLDPIRKAALLRFLYEAGLIQKNTPIIGLNTADLSRADLSGADLSGADLSSANLSFANLSGSKFEGTNFAYANLHGANLHNAFLFNANLHSTNLSAATLSGAQVAPVQLKDAGSLQGAIMPDGSKHP